MDLPIAERQTAEGAHLPVSSFFVFQGPYKKGGDLINQFLLGFQSYNLMLDHLLEEDYV